jgi:ATP-binding cassette subfamily B protein
MRLGEYLGQRIKGTLRLGPAVRFVWRGAPAWTAASVALVALQGVLPLASLYLIKLVVDAVEAGLRAPDREGAFGRVVLLIGLTGLVSLVGAVASSIANLVREAQSQTVTDYMQDVIHHKSVAVDLAYYESARYYDTLHRAQREAPFRPTRIVNGLVQLGQNGISLLAMAGLLFSLHWGVVVVLVAAAVPDVLVRARYAGQSYRWQRRRTAAERQALYLSRLLTAGEHAKEVRLLDLGPLIMARFRDLRRLLLQEKLAMARQRSAIELVTQVGATLAVFGAYAYIAYQTMQSVITLGDLVMYFQAFQRGQSALNQMMSGLAALYEDNLFLANVMEFMGLQSRVPEPVQPVAVPEPMREGIELEGVSFRYPGTSQNALQEISLRIRPGEHIALVGANGSGKTTLIKLLCRLYDPTEGRITLDGVDLRGFETGPLRRQISVVFQDYARYHLTARENIWFGDTTQRAENGRVVAAAQLSGADEVIARLPRGYDTVLGKQFQDGAELSIGEWQKVALARAFMREAQIIVLDEPTSSLDARAEYEVFERFRQLARGRTAVLISHRFSTVRMADHIYVLDGGRVIESGGHDELVRLGGTYARLFQLQASSYR